MVTIYHAQDQAPKQFVNVPQQSCARDRKIFAKCFDTEDWTQPSFGLFWNLNPETCLGNDVFQESSPVGDGRRKPMTSPVSHRGPQQLFLTL